MRGTGGRHLLSRLLAALALCLASAGPVAADAAASRAPTLDSVRQHFEKGAAEEAMREARALVQALGPEGRDDSTRTADTLDDLVELLAAQGVEFRWGVSLARRASQLRLRLSGEDLSYARSLHNYGNFLHLTFQEDEAGIQLEKALSIRQRLLPQSSPKIAATLNSLGSVAAATGDWVSARDDYERSLRTYEQSEGYARREARVVLFNFAALLVDMGDYAAVRDLYGRLISDMERRPDAPTLLFARAHAWIAEMSHRLGEDSLSITHYEKARTVWDSAQKAAETLRKPRPVDFANTATRLATAARALGRLEESRALYLEGVKLREQLRGPNHHEVAWDLYQLAEMLHEAGRSEEARPLVGRAAGILAAPGLAAGSLRISCMRLQGIILRELGETEAARPILQRALTLGLSLYGEDHPELCPILEEQARLSLSTGHPDEARRQALRAESIAAGHFMRTAAWLSQGEALRYQGARLSGLDLALSSLGAGDARATAPAAVEEAWGAVVRARGAVLDELIARRRIVTTARDPGVDALVRQLETDRGRLAHVVVRGPGDEPENLFLEKVRLLMRSQEATERKLAARSVPFGRRLADQASGWARAHKALPRGTALIAYVRYRRFHPEGDTWKDTPSYLALVKPAGGRTEAVVLGEAEAVETLISRWRESVAKPPYAGLAPPGRQGLDASEAAGTALRKAIWDPVASRLGQERLILVVPDGDIHQVPLAALPAGEGRFLVEGDRVFHHLSSERDLWSGTSARRGKGLLAMGSPDFEGAPHPDEKPGRASARGGSNEPLARLPRFLPLAGARAEVEGIAGLWKEQGAEGHPDEALVFVGRDATEQRLTTLAPGRQIIHLATHAFSAADDAHQAASGARGIPLRINPLLSSGLAMAGANARSDAGPRDADQLDGVLLGEEILSLDLSGVSWVVLSACGTGLGPIQDREGVHGLRRSFQAAGAATVITTLWEVEDSATRGWMTGLYRARREGLSTAEAVSRASREFIRQARRDGRAPHPYYWGGFVATGDWR